MCGIVGYLGPLNPKDVILAGLQKLEYRGYDSAGVSILHAGQLKRVRAEGKLKNLQDKLINEKFDGHLGIGHTRWATHGVPSERNAHPHQVGGISLVHNGIIENYLEIREELLEGGAKITSDTDSELVAHLIAHEVEVQGDLLKSVQSVLKRLRGAFSILVIWDKQPDSLVAFKDGPPLVVGLGKKENFVVSDVQAAIQHTQKFVYLEDREIVMIKGEEVQFFNSDGKKIKKEVTEVNWSPEQAEKRGFSHYMLKEVFEQPQAVASAIEPHLNPATHQVSLKDLDMSLLNGIEKITIVACGTSNYAGQVGKYMIETLAEIPVEVDIASEFRYRQPILQKNQLVLTISQSGETADTLAAIRLAKQKGIRTLSICNVRNSTIDREANGHLYMNCGTEIGVASTKAFVATLSLLQVVAIAIAKSVGKIDTSKEQQYVRDLLAVPSQIETVLSYNKYFSEAANSLREFKGFLYMGRGVQFPIALEGALKLKELAYLHAEGYAAGEMKHGPLALIDKNMAIIMLAPSDELYEKTVSNLEEARARGGVIISIGTGENTRLKSISSRYLGLPQANWMNSAILSVVPLQLMAYHLANNLGHDVDQPRNLAKSVTVE